MYAVALDADGAAANDQFGSSVWLSGAGDLLVVDSPFATVRGIAGRGSATGSTASQFGGSVSIAGGSILVGGPKHDGNGRRAASARSGCRAAGRGWKGPSLPFA